MSCCYYDGHLEVVTYSRRIRDGFRLRYWLRCWHCDIRVKLTDRSQARVIIDDWWMRHT